MDAIVLSEHPIEEECSHPKGFQPTKIGKRFICPECGISLQEFSGANSTESNEEEAPKPKSKPKLGPDPSIKDLPSALSGRFTDAARDVLEKHSKANSEEVIPEDESVHESIGRDLKRVGNLAWDVLTAGIEE